MHAALQNQISGITTIAQQRALDRIKAELQAKLKSIQQSSA